MVAATKGVRIEGMDELKAKLTDVLPREARNILRRTTLKIASDVRDKVRQRSPVDTGNLKRSIKSKRDKGTPTNITSSVYVDRSGGKSGKGYHYHFVEFGTVKMPAQPFIVPTVEEMRPSLSEEYRKEFGAQFEKELQKRAKKK